MPQNYHMYLVFIQKNLIQAGGPKESQEISDNFQIPWTNFSKTDDPSFGDFSWSNYNDSFELALIGNKVRALRNPFLERYELIEKYKIF